MILAATQELSLRMKMQTIKTSFMRFQTETRWTAGHACFVLAKDLSVSRPCLEAFFGEAVWKTAG